MKSFLLLAFYFVRISGECGPQQTQINEGTRLCCYYDTKNIPTIGVGFNLRRSDAKSRLEDFNLSLTDVLNDCKYSTRDACLTEEQAKALFDVTYSEANTCALGFISDMPNHIYAALTDVAFAGCGVLNQFVRMRAALEQRNWGTAADELESSKWCRDVKERRCSSTVSCIRSTCGNGGMCPDNYICCNEINPDQCCPADAAQCCSLEMNGGCCGLGYTCTTTNCIKQGRYDGETNVVSKFKAKAKQIHA